MKPTNMQPLFIVTGASCAGKSTVCEVLFKAESRYIVMESDLLWSDMYNTPADNYREYRKIWLNVCANISQIGMPVVLCGCVTPEQFENLPERKLFSAIHYLAVVCDNDVLKTRMLNGRGVTDENWISSSTHFNNWLKENADKTSPRITLLDTSALSPKQAAAHVNNWILEKNK